MGRKRKPQRKPRRPPARSPKSEPEKGRQRFFWLLMILLAAAPLLALGAWIYHLSDPASWAEDRLLRYAATRLTPEQKEALQARLARTVPGLWQPVPEPGVTYLLQPGIDKPSKGTRVRSNRAGMRSRREFTSKRQGRFRIVCLGDSLVMGTGGREEDRWGDQMEAMLERLGVTVGGRSIEVYSLGLDGWTALNEATYLTSRISDYRPDLVLVMMFQNDITDSGAVLGNGLVTYGFSSESRADGSGVMIASWPNLFGVAQQNLLFAGLGTESRTRWQRTFAAWKRLEDLVEEIGGRMLFSFLRANRLFGELCKHHHQLAGMRSPVLVTGYFRNSLPHDPHPDREGHRILATHYLHALAALGWLPVAAGDLPPLHSRLTAEPAAPFDPELLAELAGQVIRERLEVAIDFARLRPRTTRALLGGIFPGSISDRLGSPPYGSTRSAFLLRRQPGAERLVLEIEVPPRVELFPLELELRIDGMPGATLELAAGAEAGRHVLTASLPAAPPGDSALEVLLLTDSYWTEIRDPTMKSYRLLSVRQE